MAEAPACPKWAGGRLYIRHKESKIYGARYVLRDDTVNHMYRRVEICRTILGWTDCILSVGWFFAVFFTSGFMEIARHMKMPELWAGMGRAVNNITAAVIANPVLALLSSDSSLAVVILVLVLFVAVSIVAAIYTFQKKTFMEQLVTNAAEAVSEKEKLRKFSEVFRLRKEKLRCLAVLSIRRTAFRQLRKTCMFPDGLWNGIFLQFTKRQE